MPPPQEPEPAPAPQTEAPPPARPAPPRGGYYKDDGPGENPPANLAEIPDAQPKPERLIQAANRPYTVFGQSYEPLRQVQPFQQTGMASWYGRRFHGQKTSSGEPYDMYAMTAAHPTLPIPSYARVTNLANGRSVVVRINDRGPFHSERIIDLSYTAAYKLGYAAAGSARVEVQSILPDEPAQTAATPAPAQTAATPAPAQTAATPAPAQTAATPAPAQTAATSAPAQTAATPAAVQGPAGNAVYLQLGAFSSRANAEELRARIAARLASLAESIQVLSVGNLWRLHVGPYASREAARTIGERIESELNLKPLLVVR